MRTPLMHTRVMNSNCEQRHEYFRPHSRESYEGVHSGTGRFLELLSLAEHSNAPPIQAALSLSTSEPMAHPCTR